ncbi:hypothetical protein MTR67_051093 [Solanum verrucosum]|uniref:Uncharacterized protein n=1 Tax=Solanum verrucosum TaxID=315347 RepID=A0AAF1A1T4_SOLVR|nr:hypothetical protein MTR67_051093 [Solanum verrucosum]
MLKVLWNMLCRLSLRSFWN